MNTPDESLKDLDQFRASANLANLRLSHWFTNLEYLFSLHRN